MGVFKLLHTGDWHLGKRLHGVSLLEDQAYVLKGLLAQIEGEQPDVLIVAGDIFDRSVPPVEAVALADDFFCQLRLVSDCAVVMVSGNHDSPERLGFGRSFLSASGIHVATSYQDALKPIQIDRPQGSIQVFAMPFLEPVVVKAMGGDAGAGADCDISDGADDEGAEADKVFKTWANTQQGLFEHMLRQWEPLLSETLPRVLVAHAFFGAGLLGEQGPAADFGSVDPAETFTLGVEVSDSERPLSIGGHDIVEAALLAPFDYVALGHLHKPQRVGRDTVRYAGSLLKYSFSEAKQPKGVTWVALDTSVRTETPRGETPRTDDISVTYWQTELPKLRDLRIETGSLEALLEMPRGSREDFLMVRLTDEGALHEPMRRLRAVYPNCLKLERTFGEDLAGFGAVGVGADDIGALHFDLAPERVFEKFYLQVHGTAPSEEQLDLFVLGMAKGPEGEDA